MKMTKPPPFAIGSDTWPGLAKLSEECGELVQVIGKIMAYPDPHEVHPDGKGKLHDRLTEEAADVMAALEYMVSVNTVKRKKVRERVGMKLNRFLKWHEEEKNA